ncbi:hypothetical protein B6U83_00150 [Thermoplasmatales archaeon ex4484_36]|nr:MAG: hypothetical protein B6U83_00150 [Thermoplasmatales archaeon ex4484_36]
MAVKKSRLLRKVRAKLRNPVPIVLYAPRIDPRTGKYMYEKLQEVKVTFVGDLSDPNNIYNLMRYHPTYSQHITGAYGYDIGEKRETRENLTATVHLNDASLRRGVQLPSVESNNALLVFRDAINEVMEAIMNTQRPIYPASRLLNNWASMVGIAPCFIEKWEPTEDAVTLYYSPRLRVPGLRLCERETPIDQIWSKFTSVIYYHTKDVKLAQPQYYHTFPLTAKDLQKSGEGTLGKAFITLVGGTPIRPLVGEITPDIYVELDLLLRTVFHARFTRNHDLFDRSLEGLSVSQEALEHVLGNADVGQVRVNIAGILRSITTRIGVLDLEVLYNDLVEGGTEPIEAIRQIKLITSLGVLPWFTANADAHADVGRALTSPRSFTSVGISEEYLDLRLGATDKEALKLLLFDLLTYAEIIDNFSYTLASQFTLIKQPPKGKIIEWELGEEMGGEIDTVREDKIPLELWITAKIFKRGPNGFHCNAHVDANKILSMFGLPPVGANFFTFLTKKRKVSVAPDKELMDLSSLEAKGTLKEYKDHAYTYSHEPMFFLAERYPYFLGEEGIDILSKRDIKLKGRVWKKQMQEMSLAKRHLSDSIPVFLSHKIIPLTFIDDIIAGRFLDGVSHEVKEEPLDAHVLKILSFFDLYPINKVWEKDKEEGRVQYGITPYNADQPMLYPSYMRAIWDVGGYYNVIGGHLMNVSDLYRDVAKLNWDKVREILIFGNDPKNNVNIEVLLEMFVRHITTSGPYLVIRAPEESRKS